MRVSAALLRETEQPFELVELELDAPAAGEVCVRIVATGVCASDAHTRSGKIPSPTPCVLGHEGAGVVLSVGEGVTHVAPGDHVALSWMPNCGRCRHCEAGRLVLCSAASPYLLAGTLMDGTVRLHDGDQDVFHYSFLSTFASATVVPAASAIKIDSSIPLGVASLVGCAVLTGFGAAVNKAQVRPGDTVVVFGAGGVGLSAVMGAVIAGAQNIIVVDPLAAKREEAISFGATHAIDPNEDVVAFARSLTNGDGADVAIDAVGAPGILDTAFNATVRGGTIVCVGVPAPDARPSVPGPDLVRHEKVITGSLYGSCHPARDIPIILNYFRQGRMPLDKLITKTYALEEINAAFDDLAAGKLNRGVIVFDETLA